MFVGTQVDTMSCKGVDSVCCPLSCVFLCLYYAGSWWNTLLRGGAVCGCTSPCSIALSTVPMSRYTMRMLWWELREYFSVRSPTSILWMNSRSSSGVSSSMAVYCFAFSTNVFNRCSALTEVTIPASVTEVRGFSFMGCTALTDVYYTGTQAQWDAVRIDTSYGDPFKNAAVHVDAEQHVFGAWQTVEQPGTISRTCTNGCGLKQTAAVPALDHDWDEGVVTKESDGVLCGILHVTCKRCGAESDELLMPEIWAYEQFGDVDPTLWSYEGIQFCVMMGYMSGMDTHVFAPRGVTTRAQLVQILYNFVGGPEVSGETPFADLTANWYKDAVLWAYQTGVTSGTSETTFSPNDPVTREQVAVLLYKFADKVLEVGGAETPADLSRFPDGDQVSSWAREAMADAVALGIINGTKVDDQVFLAPQGSATRDQIATMFEGFCASLA